MAYFNQQAFMDAVNRDGEFLISARFLDGSMKLHFDDDALMLRFREGRLTGIERPSLFETATVVIKGPATSWREFLQPVPRPFFHDMFAAIVRRAFDWSGDAETFFAYYGAFRRMFQIMREHATNQE